MSRRQCVPPVAGRWLFGYRLAWWVFAAAALVAVILSWSGPGATIGLSLIRSAKAIVLVVVATILFRRRRTDPVAAMLALSFLLWTISSSVDFVTISAVPAVLDRLRFLFFALALLLFPDGRWQPSWTRPIALAIAATFLLGVVESVGILASQLFLPVAIACVLAALAALFSRYRQLDQGTQKQQLKWVVLGLVLGITLILAARAGWAWAGRTGLPMGGALFLEGLFQLGIVIVALGFLTSLLRYRLYDAEAAISRSAVGAALTLALVGIFAACEVLVELFGQQMFGMSIGNISGAIAAAVAAMMLTPLHHRISHWAEEHFQRDLALLKVALPELLSGLAPTHSLKRLGETVLPHISEAVQAARLVLLVDSKVVGVEGISLPSARKLLREWKPMADAELLGGDDDSAFPLQMALRCPYGTIRAWLLFGPRPDGSFFGRDDLDALAEIARPLQRTVLAVADREAEHRRRERMDAEVRANLAALNSRLDVLEHCQPSDCVRV